MPLITKDRLTEQKMIDAALALWKAGAPRGECLDAMPRRGFGIEPDHSLRDAWDVLLGTRDGGGDVMISARSKYDLNVSAAVDLSYTEGSTAAMMLVFDEEILVLISHDVPMTSSGTLVLSCGRKLMEDSAADMAEAEEDGEGCWAPLVFPNEAWAFEAGTGNPALQSGHYITEFEEGYFLRGRSWDDLVAATDIITTDEYNPEEICLDPRFKQRIIRGVADDESSDWREDPKQFYWATHTGIESYPEMSHLPLESEVEARTSIDAPVGALEEGEVKASQAYVDLMLALYTCIDIDEIPPPGELRRRRWRPHILLRELVARGRAELQFKNASKRRAAPDRRLAFIYDECPFELFVKIVSFL